MASEYEVLGLARNVNANALQRRSFSRGFALRPGAQGLATKPAGLASSSDPAIASVTEYLQRTVKHASLLGAEAAQAVRQGKISPDYAAILQTEFELLAAGAMAQLEKLAGR